MNAVGLAGRGRKGKLSQLTNNDLNNAPIRSYRRIFCPRVQGKAYVVSISTARMSRASRCAPADRHTHSEYP